MGTYLSCGLATKLTITKRFCKKEEILEDLKNEIDLNIYNITEEEDKIYLDIKEDIFEKYAIDFIIEQLEMMKEDERIQKAIEDTKQIKNKKYEELIQIARERKIHNFQFEDGYWVCNDVSYLSTCRVQIYADIVDYIFNGKIGMEEYNDVFKYLRRSIIKNSKNPIKSAIVISITG